MDKVDLGREMDDLKNLLSYSKNIGFFMGAGSSCAFGLPNVYSLTDEVRDCMIEDMKSVFVKLESSLIEQYPDKKKVTVEDILNYVRQIREITGENENRFYEQVSGLTAKILDEKICECIFKVIQSKEMSANIEELQKFFAWLDITHRSYTKEIFTTNYDLLLERAMEVNHIPYFDGFVGSYEPFFWPESIEKNITQIDVTFNWIRLWKIHGSLNWEFRKGLHDEKSKIVRVGKVDKIENELVVYPSKEKYSLSRKQPFIAYFDRLKNYLQNGEKLFVFTGYSFSDQHINEVIFNSLRQNPRLYSIVMCFSDEQVVEMERYASSYLNLCVMGPKMMITNGKMYEWYLDEGDSGSKDSDLYWDKTTGEFLLGDFKNLIRFLIANSNKLKKIEGGFIGK